MARKLPDGNGDNLGFGPADRKSELHMGQQNRYCHAQCQRCCRADQVQPERRSLSAKGGVRGRSKQSGQHVLRREPSDHASHKLGHAHVIAESCAASGEAVTFTATITSPTVMPTGPVTFAVGKTVLGRRSSAAGKQSSQFPRWPWVQPKSRQRITGTRTSPRVRRQSTQTVHQ